MKIVHTADWHIGKSLRGRHRGHEYKAVLKELRDYIIKESVDILIVAGDLFDSSTPSAEAENIVYNFFHDVSKTGVHSVVIAGNHDSGLRFEAISGIMELAQVRMRGFYHFDSDENVPFDIQTKDGQVARIALIPFIPERAFVRAETLSSSTQSPTNIYSQEFGKVIKDISQSFTPETVNIIVGHILMHGSKPGGGERRLYLGDNYAVHPEEIPDNIDYIALGHIHLWQNIEADSPIYYCGSPVQMDFGEKDTPKGFLVVDAEAGKLCIPEFVELREGKKLRELHGTFEEITTLIESDPKLKECYLKINIKADASTMGISYQLKKILPDAVDIRREYISTSQKELPKGDDWLPKLYKEYYEREFEKEIPAEVLSEFKKLYEICSLEK